MTRSNREPASEDLAQGKKAAFEALYDLYAGRLFRTAFGMTGSSEEAEDMVQEVFLGLMKSRTHLGEVKSLSGYLFRSLRNAVAQRSAKLKHERKLIDLEFQKGLKPTPSASEPDRGKCIEQALGRLPAEQREVIALKIDGGMTFNQIAEALKISPNTAAGRYRYALEKLHTMLKD